MLQKPSISLLTQKFRRPSGERIFQPKSSCPNSDPEGYLVEGKFLCYFNGKCQGLGPVTKRTRLFPFDFVCCCGSVELRPLGRWEFYHRFSWSCSMSGKLLSLSLHSHLSFLPHASQQMLTISFINKTSHSTTMTLGPTRLSFGWSWRI